MKLKATFEKGVIRDEDSLMLPHVPSLLLPSPVAGPPASWYLEYTLLEVSWYVLLQYNNLYFKTVR